MLLDQLESDLKASLLARDEVRVSTLRSLKSALTYASVDEKAKGNSGDLSDEQVLTIFAKESKKRQESADAFTSGDAKDRAERELAEKKIIDGYLPAQLTDDELLSLVNEAIKESSASDIKAMGRVVGLVKAKAGSRADGARIAALVKERLAG
jgi:uncharacterized protein YqeY